MKISTKAAAFAMAIVASSGANNVVVGQNCTSDDDCLAVNLPADGGANYCAAGTCAPIGTCPNSVIDCKNPSNSPYPVLACVGYIACSEESTCGQVCSNEQCANGVTFQPCDPDALPCDAEDIADACPEAASCVNDPCSGADSCAALYFDAAGNVVCPIPVLFPETETETGSDPMGDMPVTLPICESDEQCGEDAYCASGDCLPVAACYTDRDCTNPSNAPYAIAQCVGPLVCAVAEGQTVGTCGVPDCNGFFCADGSERREEPCPDCDVDLCSEAVSCFMDSCQETCTPIYYGADGSQVCLPDPVNPSLSCSSDDDCLPDAEYCLQGTCAEGGTCGDLADCFNPSNLYAVAMCVGPLVCEENFCGVPDCNGQFCSEGLEPEENCPDCDIMDCAEAVSCAVSNCGGCNNHFFDAEGNQVCLPTTLPVTDTDPPVTLPACTTDADCNMSTAESRQAGDGMQPEFFCGQGVCREMGSCGSALDCHNPSNEFAMIECVGHLYCDAENRCAVECGPGCEDGSEWSVCEVTPCNDPAQPCPEATSCFNDVCNGCNAVYLDAAGNDMTEDCPVPEPFTAQEDGDDDDDNSAASVSSAVLSFVAVLATMSALFL